MRFSNVRVVLVTEATTMLKWCRAGNQLKVSTNRSQDTRNETTGNHKRPNADCTCDKLSEKKYLCNLVKLCAHVTLIY